MILLMFLINFCITNEIQEKRNSDKKVSAQSRDLTDMEAQLYLIKEERDIAKRAVSPFEIVLKQIKHNEMTSSSFRHTYTVYTYRKQLVYKF